MKILITLGATLFFGVAFSQKPLTENTYTIDSTFEKGEMKIEQLQFLTGFWEGEGLGGIVQEQWSTPEANSMIGSFRMIEDGMNNFFELLLLEETENGIIYKVKHFSNSFEAWEDKSEFASFQLLKISEDSAYFDGLTIVVKDGRCTQYLAMKQKDGSYKEYKFILISKADIAK